MMNFVTRWFALPAIALWLSACQTSPGSGPDFSALSSVRPQNPASSETADSNPKQTFNIGSGLAVDVYALPGAIVQFASAPARRAPVLIYVHGGGWAKGSREKIYALPAYAKSRDYVFVLLDYRPVPRTNADGQAADVARGINWVRANIASHGGDPARIVIMGHSAGSHLVALVAARKLGGSLRGVIANDEQAYDLAEYHRLRNNSMDPIYERAFGYDRANWARWSPVTHVKSGAGFPPFLILYSKSDYERRKALANSFARVLRAKGTRVVLYDGRAYTHGSIGASIGKSAGVTSAVDQFLQSVFRGKP